MYIFFSGFSGSQASSQAAAASFGSAGQSVSGAASQAAAFGGGFGNNFGSQSASSAFGFNSINAFQQPDVSTYNFFYIITVTNFRTSYNIYSN